MSNKKAIKILSLALIILFLSWQVGLADICRNRSNSRPDIIPAVFSLNRPASRADRLSAEPDQTNENQQPEEYNLDPAGIKVTIQNPEQYSEAELADLSTMAGNLFAAVGALMNNPGDGKALAAYYHWLDKIIKYLDKKFRGIFQKILDKENKKKEVADGTGINVGKLK